MYHDISFIILNSWYPLQYAQMQCPNIFHRQLFLLTQQGKGPSCCQCWHRQKLTSPSSSAWWLHRSDRTVPGTSLWSCHCEQYFSCRSKQITMTIININAIISWIAKKIILSISWLDGCIGLKNMWCSLTIFILLFVCMLINITVSAFAFQVLLAFIFN